MNSVLRIGVTEHTGQTANRSIHRHRSVGTPYDVFTLLAETSFLGAAGHLIPYRTATPDPSSPLQSVGNRRILPPVNEQTNRRSRFAGFSGVRKPFSHPSGPTSLILLISVKIGQGVFFVHAAVLLIGGAVFLGWLPPARSVGRIGNNGVKHLRLECPDYLQGISVQNGPTISAAVFHGQNGFVNNLSQFFRFVQRHLPF